MEKEFELSEKIYPIKISIFDKAKWVLNPKDVKEFIKRLKEGETLGMQDKIDKLAGDELK